MKANTPSSGFSPDQYRQTGFTGPVPLLSEEEAAAGRKAYFTAIGQSRRRRALQRNDRADSTCAIIGPMN